MTSLADATEKFRGRYIEGLPAKWRVVKEALAPLGQLVGDAHGRVAHLGPVLHRLAHVAQHALQVCGELLMRQLARLPVDLDVHP